MGLLQNCGLTLNCLTKFCFPSVCLQKSLSKRREASTSSFLEQYLVSPDNIWSFLTVKCHPVQIYPIKITKSTCKSTRSFDFSVLDRSIPFPYYMWQLNKWQGEVFIFHCIWPKNQLDRVTVGGTGLTGNNVTAMTRWQPILKTFTEHLPGFSKGFPRRLWRNFGPLTSSLLAFESSGILLFLPLEEPEFEEGGEGLFSKSQPWSQLLSKRFFFLVPQKLE